MNECWKVRGTYGGQRRSSITNLHLRLGMVNDGKWSIKQHCNGVREVHDKLLQDGIDVKNCQK